MGGLSAVVVAWLPSGQRQTSGHWPPFRRPADGQPVFSGSAAWDVAGEADSGAPLNSFLPSD